jgi:hypothetical protein
VPPLALLFVFLAAGFAGLAYASATADAPVWRWLIAVAAAVFAVWFVQTAYRMMRKR